VWLEPGQDKSPAVVHKSYTSGSLAEAEREFAMGKAAAGAGVAEYLSAQIDPRSNRPAVTIGYQPGANLEAVVLQHGALPAKVAMTIIQSVAQTLARLHTLSADSLPNGMCHGDIKPQNILLEEREPDQPASTYLLDFEHATAIGTGTANPSDDATFTGGTHGFAAPEAFQGAQPNAAFDVFGLGATLSYLLDGGTARLLPRHPDVEALVQECCADDPAARPTAAELVRRCDRLTQVLRDDAYEQNLDDWARGNCHHKPSDTSDSRAWMWLNRRRLMQRLPTLLQRPSSTPQDPAGLQHELDLTIRVLARFPRSADALARRRQLLDATRRLLLGTAASVRERIKAEQFEDALQWIRSTDSLLRTALSVGGGLAVITRLEPTETPGALHRAPIEYLRMLEQQAEAAQQELEHRAGQISQAELALDLERAEQEIDAMAAHYGGTSKTVAERRDQLYRLGFYLDRIARAETNVDRADTLWDSTALKPLKALVADAAKALETFARREHSGSGTIGLRSLQVTLTNITGEFPHLTQVTPALSALSDALMHLTDQAWQQLDDAEQRLGIVPVPVRPLQLALGRLDTIRMLEAFIDRPERSRTDLLDGIERLRLGLEEARSARDRLAENAEHALARGHWTTGLFDMERAVERLNPNDETEHNEVERLRERLQAARRTKQEIEVAVRRNVELTASYTALEDDPLSTAESRLRALQERRDCLMFLTLHVPNERAELYRKDLRSVETQIAVEHAASAEQRLDAMEDPVQRLRLARSTAEQLFATTPPDGGAQPGRLTRLQNHWRTVAVQCQRAVDQNQAEQAERQRHRRRTMAIAIVALIITTTAVGFALKPFLFGEPVMAAPK